MTGRLVHQSDRRRQHLGHHTDGCTVEMVTILRMKMAWPFIYLPTQRGAGPALQSGVRFFNLMTTGQGDGIKSTPAMLTHYHYRSFSQLMTLVSSASSATQMDLLIPILYHHHHRLLPSPAKQSGYEYKYAQNQECQYGYVNKEGWMQATRIMYQNKALTQLLYFPKQLHPTMNGEHCIIWRKKPFTDHGHDKFDTKYRNWKTQTLKRRLYVLFETEEEKQKSDESATVDAEYLWSLDRHLWVQQTIYTYSMGKLFDKPYKNCCRQQSTSLRKVSNEPA